MADKKVVVLIPFWVQEIVRRSSLPLSACLELDKLKPLMSVNDLATFLALQDRKYLKLLTGIDNELGNLIWEWSFAIPNTNVELCDFVWKTLEPLSKDESVHNEIKNRLFTSESLVDTYKEAFALYDLTPEVYGIVVYPGHVIVDNNIVLQKSLIESIIEVLYRYYSFHEVAKTPFFRRYLEILSKNII